MDALVSINGVLTPLSEGVIPVTDRGFLYGDSVFEVFVAFGDQVLDEQPHLDRLRQSAQRYGISIPWSDSDLRFDIHALIEQTKFSKTNIRLVVSRGSAMGLSPLMKSKLEPNKVIIASPAHLETDRTYREGVALKRKALGYTDRGANAKLSQYIDSIHGLVSAQKHGFDDILWSNSEGELTEASTANVFFMGRSGDLVEIATPPAHSGILLGITRARIIQLLSAASIPVTERIIYVDEIPRFDEGFLCSTVRGLVPIARVDEHKLHTRRPNAVFQHIERLFHSWVATELGSRVDWNTGIPIEN